MFGSVCSWKMETIRLVVQILERSATRCKFLLSPPYVFREQVGPKRQEIKWVSSQGSWCLWLNWSKIIEAYWKTFDFFAHLECVFIKIVKMEIFRSFSSRNLNSALFSLQESPNSTSGYGTVTGNFSTSICRSLAPHAAGSCEPPSPRRAGSGRKVWSCGSGEEGERRTERPLFRSEEETSLTSAGGRRRSGAYNRERFTLSAMRTRLERHKNAECQSYRCGRIVPNKRCLHCGLEIIFDNCLQSIFKKLTTQGKNFISSKR